MCIRDRRLIFKRLVRYRTGHISLWLTNVYWVSANSSLSDLFSVVVITENFAPFCNKRLPLSMDIPYIRMIVYAGQINVCGVLLGL